MELPVPVIQRTESRLVADRCPQRFAPDRCPKAHIPRQPGDRTASGPEVPAATAPDLAHAIDTRVLLEHAPDLDLEMSVSADPVGQTGGDRLAWRLRCDRSTGRSWLELAVELRPGEISRRLAKDLIRLPEFPVLALQRLQLLGDFSWNATPHNFVDLGLLDPLIERLSRAADLRSNRSHSRLPRGMIFLVLENQPNRACAHFG